MIKERHHEKLTKNERRTLDYIISKAEFEHSLSVEVTPTELMEELHFKSLMTSYNVTKKLIEKKLITKLADELTLDANKFVFQKDEGDKEILTLRYMLQELQTERDVFPFLEPENRVKYFQMVSQNREEAYKIDYQLTKDICKLADAGIYEFPLKPLKAKVEIEVEHCFKVLAYHDFHSSNDTVYEPREIEQCINYLSSVSLDDIYKYSPFTRENTDYLLNEWVRDEVDCDE